MGSQTDPSLKKTTAAELCVELLDDLTELANAEANLAQAKVLEHLHLKTKQLYLSLLAYSIALLSAAALTAAAITALSSVLNNRHWLAALLVASALLLIALPITLWRIRKGGVKNA